MKWILYYVGRYWVTVLFFLFAWYFHVDKMTMCGSMPVELLGFGEMTWMWVMMGIVHGMNYCYCDLKKLFK
jgi:hypothetical protein